MNTTIPAYHARRLSRSGLALVLALHLAALWGLARMESISRPAPPTVLTASLLANAAPAPAPPRIEAPRPVTKAMPPLREPVPEPLPIALPAEAPVAAPVAASVVAAPPVAAPAETSPVSAPPPPAAAPTPPRFDANYLDNPKPSYPPLARRLGEEGRVVLRVQVAATGLPREVSVHSSSGSARLDRTAVDAVRRWQFVPARLGNEAVAAAVLVPIVFSLND